jgi:hypothetical protein
MKMALCPGLLACPPGLQSPDVNLREIRVRCAANSVGGGLNVFVGDCMGREGEARSFGEVRGCREGVSTRCRWQELRARGRHGGQNTPGAAAGWQELLHCISQPGTVRDL